MHCYASKYISAYTTIVKPQSETIETLADVPIILDLCSFRMCKMVSALKHFPSCAFVILLWFSGFSGSLFCDHFQYLVSTGFMWLSIRKSLLKDGSPEHINRRCQFRRTQTLPLTSQALFTYLHLNSSIYSCFWRSLFSLKVSHV